MSIELDHVVLAVTDLMEAAHVMESDLGLLTAPGGRHSGHGTANRIVPLGSTYLELVGVVDDEEAAASPFGTWVGSRATGNLTPHLVCLRTESLVELADRLEIRSTVMGRRRPDGAELRWKLAGLDKALEEGLPFFIEWDIDPADHPGRSGLPQASGDVSVEVSIGGDPGVLRDWTSEPPGLSFPGGEPGVRSVVIRANWGEVTL